MDKLNLEIDLTTAVNKAILENGYQMGLGAAARLLESWADQCCGGSGEGGEGYRNAAAAIRKIDPAKGY